MIETKDLFAKSDLIPVIIQDRATKDILMLGYTNQEAYQKTLETHTAWFWSRRRQKLWNKGETSGHFLYVKKMITDCDTDTLLYLCDPVGPTCHTGRRSCFFNGIWTEAQIQNALQEQYEVVVDRKIHDGGEKSYTNYLYREGLDKILKKCGEECFEAVIAAKDEDTPETLGELCDVFYHTAVLLGNEDVTLDAVLAEVNTRCQQEGQPMDALFDVIRERQHSEDENSYTAYLFRELMDNILKKLREACSLLLIAAKAGDKAGIAAEMGNLYYHLMVMMVCKGIAPQLLGDALDKRNGKTGNLKQFHTTDQNS